MVYVFLADGFEEVEALTPVDYMRRAGIETVTVGVTGKTVIGAHNISVVADVSIDEVCMNENVEGIVLPGGMPGTLNLENNEYVQTALDYAVKNKLMIGAICAAPSILGHKNLLDSKQAVCFPGFEKDLYGAVISDGFCVTDSNIITARGAGAAPDFAFAIIAYMLSDSTAEQIRTTVQTPDR